MCIHKNAASHNQLSDNMKFLFNVYIVISTVNLMSCATSMTPLEMNRKLPQLTTSKYISSQTDTYNCELLNKSRKYNAPLGFTVQHDLKNGAKGIDEWVVLDGGNAYKLINYQWVQVDDFGSTQLQIEFDTMKCDFNK